VITPAPEPPPPARVIAPRPPASTESSEQLTRSGTDAMLRGDLAGAAQKFDQAIAANPSDAAAHRGKALVLERQGRTHDAAAAFRAYLKLRPTGTASDKIRERLEELEAN
jgi:Flp pilus assembly protein TadD